MTDTRQFPASPSPTPAGPSAGRRPPRRFLNWIMCPAGIALLLLFSVVTAGPAEAATVNAIQLDNGTCGQNLQQGTNATASPTTTPSFLLTGDGGLSSYS